MTTAMTDIDDFLPEVMRHAPNASDIVAQRHIVSAARMICERGLMWRESYTITITTPEGQAIDMGDDRSLVQIKNASLDGEILTPVTTEWLDREHENWDLETDTNTARYITQIEPNTIIIYPRQVGSLIARCVLKPARKAMELPTFLLEQHFETIGLGAGAAILTDPASQNPQLGIDLRNRFEERLNLIATAAAKGQQGARPRVRGEYM